MRQFLARGVFYLSRGLAVILLPYAVVLFVMGVWAVCDWEGYEPGDSAGPAAGFFGLFGVVVSLVFARTSYLLWKWAPGLRDFVSGPRPFRSPFEAWEPREAPLRGYTDRGFRP